MRLGMSEGDSAETMETEKVTPDKTAAGAEQTLPAAAEVKAKVRVLDTGRTGHDISCSLSVLKLAIYLRRGSESKTCRSAILSPSLTRSSLSGSLTAPTVVLTF